MLNIRELKKYYNGKRVLITGHTGFKGSYMCVLLKYLGAKVYGYSLKPEKGGLYELLSRGIKEVSAKSKQKTAGIKQGDVGANACGALNSKSLVEAEVFADIRDIKKLTAFVKKVKPDYALHMAAQPLVLLGYEKPRYTYEVNVMGTVNLLEAIRLFVGDDILSSRVGADTIRPLRRGELCEPISILNVTTDKVYENNDLSNYAFKEKYKLCGRDPYANSKSCSELVTYAYEKSFFADKNIYRVSTARAGNVIGGGDLNANRIIPDCYRSIKNKKDMLIRNPKSIRPYQFVLEPLILYLNIMALQKRDKKYEGNYNIGPDKKACLTTAVLTKKFFEAWAKTCSQNLPLHLHSASQDSNAFMPKCVISTNSGVSVSTKRHESKFLRLDNSLIKKVFKYKEIFNMNKTMEHTAKVYHDMLTKNNLYRSIIEIIETLD